MNSFISQNTLRQIPSYKPQQDQEKEKEGDYWQVKSIIYLKVHTVQSTVRCTVPTCSTPSLLVSTGHKMNTRVQQPAKLQTKWPYQARWD